MKLEFLAHGLIYNTVFRLIMTNMKFAGPGVMILYYTY